MPMEMSVLQESKISTEEGAGSRGGIVIREEVARLLVRRQKKKEEKNMP